MSEAAAVILCRRRAPAKGEDVTQPEFLRRARRLRWRLRNRPAELHRSLRTLGLDRDRGAGLERLGPTGQFEQMVLAELEDGVLRFSKREMLLVRAGAMGIERFAASLIISTVQQRRGSSLQGQAGAPGWKLAAGAVLLVQGMIGWGMWWASHL